MLLYLIDVMRNKTENNTNSQFNDKHKRLSITLTLPCPTSDYNNARHFQTTDVSLNAIKSVIHQTWITD